MPRLAAQLRHLFATVPRAANSKELWTNEHFAAAMTEAGVPTSAAYMSQLRTGARTNPSARHLAAVARIFEVPMEYFFDEALAAKVDSDLQLVLAVREAGVEGIALRARGLSPESLAGVSGMIEHIRHLEQLPPLDGEEKTPPVSDPEAS